MPVVPRPENRIEQAPLGNARVQVQTNPEAFGGGKPLEKADAAFQNLNNDITRIASHEKQKADESRSKVSAADLLRKTNELKYGKDGFMHRKGANALSGTQEAIDNFKKFVDETENSLSNPDQKNMFRNFATGQMADFEGEINRHSANEAENYQKEANNSLVMAAREDAVLNWGDPAKLKNSLQTQDIIVEDQAAQMGLSGQGKELLRQEVRSKTVLGVVSAALDNKQYPQAQALYDEHKDGMSAPAREDAEKLLKSSKIEHVGFETSRDLMRKYGASSQALQKAMEIEDSDVRKQTMDNIKDTITIRKAQQEEFEKANFKRAADLVENTKERPPATIWAKLSLSERKALDDRREQLIKGVDPETDMSVYQDLSNAAATDPSSFANQNLALNQSKLSKSDFKKFVDLQAKVRAEGSTGGFGTQQDIVSKTLMESGINPNPKSMEAKKKIGLFYRRFRERVDGLGAKPSDKDVQAIADSLLTETVTDKGWVWDSTKKTYEVSIEDVPKSDLAEIRAALKSKKIPDTDANILQVYTRGNSAK
jgi:hypothetical protein